MESIHFASAIETASLVRSGKVTPLELIEATLERIDTINRKINAFVSLRAERALEEARALTDALTTRKNPPPLAGIPLAVKDLEDVEGMPTTFGSVPFKDNIASRDSIQVERLRKAGAIVVGKTNTPEFGHTGFTKNRLFGVTRNPWNLERTSGGSSGGSAAAIAAGMVPLATGSDGGGSIRIPSCYCGCFGLKPSCGRIPDGPKPLLRFTDIAVLGPITRTVADAALYLDCAAGYHPADPESLPEPGMTYLAALENMPEKLKIAFSPDLGRLKVQSDISSLVEDAVRAFEEMGHRVELLDEVMPDVGDAWNRLFSLDIYGMLRDHLDKYGPEINRTLVASLQTVEKLTVPDLVEAQKIKTEHNKLLWRLFDSYDLLLTPAMPSEAFAAEGPPPSEIEGTPIGVLDVVGFTYPFNLSGHPAASVPVGFTKNGLPAGLQIVAPHLRDDLVLQAARAFEKARPWNKNRPPVD